MSNPKNSIAILILAAGASRRMGQPKQLLPWGNSTLLQHAIRHAKGLDINKIGVVLGAYAQKIQKSLSKYKVELLMNPNWEDGLGSSLAYGIKNLVNTEQTLDGILVMLGDQPLIDTSYLNRLMEAFASENKGIIVTSYGNRVGVPAVFSSRYFSELTDLDRDQGAKEIIRKYKGDMYVVDPEGKAIDLDTKEAYDALLTKMGL